MDKLLKTVLDANLGSPAHDAVRAMLQSGDLVVVDPRARDDVWPAYRRIDGQPAMMLLGEPVALYTAVTLKDTGNTLVLSIVGGEVAAHPAAWATENNAQHL